MNISTENMTSSFRWPKKFTKTRIVDNVGRHGNAGATTQQTRRLVSGVSFFRSTNLKQKTDICSAGEITGDNKPNKRRSMRLNAKMSIVAHLSRLKTKIHSRSINWTLEIETFHDWAPSIVPFRRIIPAPHLAILDSPPMTRHTSCKVESSS